MNHIIFVTAWLKAMGGKKKLTAGGKYCVKEPMFVAYHWLTADKKDGSKNVLSVCTLVYMLLHTIRGWH